MMRRSIAFVVCAALLGCSDRATRFDGAVDAGTSSAKAALWTTTAVMSQQHTNGTVIPLALGKALVVGGAGYDSMGNPVDTKATDRFDAGSWSTGPVLTSGHFWAGAVTLTGGKTLVVGANMISDLYDPGANAFTATPTSTSRTQCGLAALASNRAIAFGGAGAATTSDLFNGTTNTWSAGPVMAVGRARPATATLANGKVLAIGGSNSTALDLSTVELYDPGTNSWTPAASMKTPRSAAGAVTLTNGKVLVVGGFVAGLIQSSAEIYDPAANTWNEVAPTATPREQHATVLLASGKVFVAGGPTNKAEIYDPATDTWTPAGTTSALRARLAFGRLTSGVVLLAGGQAITGSPISFTADTFAQSQNGATCTTGYDCASLFCVDGVCCDATCTGACQACDVATTVGTCSAVASGAPRGVRSCGAYTSCSAGACKSSCAADAECTTGNVCVAATCIPAALNGASCARNGECASGFCVDGTCCNSACTDNCAACDVPTRVGTCSAVTGVPHGARPACTVGAGTPCGQQCNGADTTSCHYLPAGQPACSANACTTAAGSSVETRASTCDGEGKCSDVPKSCGTFACGANACLATCTTIADCAPGHICKSSTCLAAPTLGDPCVDASSCGAPLACTDGVCCGVASCGTGLTCNAPGRAGRCSKSNGIPCAAASECGSGFCVDGVCCNGACDGQCAACDVPGKLGSCSPASGVPHGTRATCAVGTETCKARICDGSDPSKCTAYAPMGTSCSSATCVGGVAKTGDSCDGSGTCKRGASTECTPYACDAAACKSSCAADTDCASSYRCTAGKCVPTPEATCGSDNSSTDRSGGVTPCAPYRCATDGKCATACKTSDDCVEGKLCALQVCVDVSAPPSAGEADSGGCTTPRRSTDARGVPFAVMVLAWMVRRRSVRR